MDGFGGRLGAILLRFGQLVLLTLLAHITKAANVRFGLSKLVGQVDYLASCVRGILQDKPL